MLQSALVVACALPRGTLAVECVWVVWQLLLSMYHCRISCLNLDGLRSAGHANQDSIAVARDQVYIVRDSAACPSRLAGKGTSAGAPPAPAAATDGAAG